MPGEGFWIPLSQRAAHNGVGTLDSEGHQPVGQLPGLAAGTIDSRDANGNPTSITEGGVTTTYTWNAEGNPATETRGGHTKTFAYTGGVLTGWTVA